MTRVDLTAGVLALGAERFCGLGSVREALRVERQPR